MTDYPHIPARIDAERIQRRIHELAREIEKDFSDKALFLLGVALGGLPFMGDLLKAFRSVYPSAEVRIQSYHDTRSSQAPVLLDTIPADVRGRDVLIIDDIYDTGATLSALIQSLENAGAASVTVCVLLTKSRTHECPVDIAYSGFEFPDVFAVGYGLDYNGAYRDLPYIGELSDPERYTPDVEGAQNEPG